MNRRLARLSERRSGLLERIAEQRAEFTGAAAPLRARLRLADRGIAALRGLRRHPGLIALGVLLVVALRPRRAVTWLKRGWWVWEIGQSLQRR